LPDLTTRARRAAIDSVDFAAFDFFVGAIAIVGFVGGEVECLRPRLEGLLIVTKLRFRHLPCSSLSSRDIVRWTDEVKLLLCALPPAMEAYIPSHPGLFEVDFKEQFCSALIARKVRLSDVVQAPKS